MPRIDPRAVAIGVQAHDGVLAKVESVAYLDGVQTRGNIGIYVRALYKKFPVWGARYTLLLPGSVDEFATYPDLKIDMGGGGFMPDRGERGPFKIQMADAYVDGMGLPANQHVVYIVQFILLKSP